MKNVWLLIPFITLSLSAKEIDFNRDIRPILSDNCFHCHGPDGGEYGELWKGGLRLDVEEGAKADLSLVKLEVKNAKRKAEGKEVSTKKSKAKFAIVSGAPEKSSLISRIYTDDEDDVMPPRDSNHSLSDAEKKLLKDWIARGATWGKHWSFVTPKKSNLPKVKSANWIKNEIDSFVLARLEEKGVKPSAEASKEVWIRRVSLDLTGLPATPSEVDAFLKDNSQDSYETVVDRLLMSPSYAERMTLDWLDSARYADTSGYQYDMERSMWPWRDWVIQAFHKNTPFDQFVTEQLAGDLLPNSSFSQKIATGFNRNHGFTIEGGVIEEEYRVQYVNDRVNTFGTVFLGLTMDCTRCHNHKYDPLTAKDYYSISAFFDKIKEKGKGNGRGALAIPPMINYPLYDKTELAQLEQDVSAALNKPFTSRQHQAYNQWHQDFYSSKSYTEFTAVKAKSGALVEKKADYSYLFTGKLENEEVYTFSTTVPAGKINSLVIEALVDPSMVKSGPGRAENGNAVLSYVEATIGQGDSAKKVRFQNVLADFTQKGFKVSDILKGNTKGWAVGGEQKHENRLAVLGLKKTLDVKADETLTVKLHFKSPYAKHVFGRVRLDLSKEKSTDLFNKLKMKNAFLAKKIPESRLKDYYLKNIDKEVSGLVSKLSKMKKNVVPVMIMEESPTIRQTHLLERGEYDKKGEKVAAATPSFLPPLLDSYPKNRLGLAKWLTDERNPLFARVTVNRFWQLMFGVGLVKTTEDFGAQGEKPSHPELLDWLAVDFRENDWDVHQLLKKIVLSATYRQSSKIRNDFDDPENRLLARGARFRLQGELIRDQALFASGLLSDKTGGPSVYPYQPAGLWLELTNRPGFQIKYQHSKGEDLYRKSMYSYWKRALPNPSLTAFDAPERDVCIVSRAKTNTPLQALTLLHDPTYLEAARVLAVRSLESSSNIDEAIKQTFRKVVGRVPSFEEAKILNDVFEKKLVILKNRPELITSQLSVGEFKIETELPPERIAAFTSVCHILFNLSETITKN
ncbi:MAG: PSD1 and planctomycete cytochrome C domain-containing protein [Lentisphaeraceae bacterium]|nr:PSD1 and planctomycete cytochrome C domain-containing protein [Lentisphaeraceae bacterium]